MKSKEYRADIDGLRAIAVLFVLFFHLEIGLFSSGFVGVDVFFTISGFLITTIVLKESGCNDFSFGRFYTRRALRLLPAYLFLLLFVIAFSALIMAPIAFGKFLQSAIASGFFVSNFYFLFEQGGYFTTSASELPLLHTWSLSVEEQFYLLMPIALILLQKYCPKRHQFLVLILFLFFSVLCSYFLTDFHQKLAYFVVFSRAHEFLLGSVLSFAILYHKTKFQPSLLVANVIFLLSFLTLCASAMLTINKNEFPGVLALIPCLATCGIIYSGLHAKCLSHKLLGFRPLVFIGLLSYSLYLWHWPIISFLKYSGIELTLLVKFFVLIASFMAAYASWRFIETKVRYAKFKSRQKVAVSLYILPCVCLVLLYSHAQSQSFYPERFDKKIVVAEQAAKSTPELGRETCHSPTLTKDDSDCVLGIENDYETSAILWGDSHANHFVGFIDVFGKEKNMLIHDVTMGNCPPVASIYINAQGAKQACQDKNTAVLKYILSESPDFVFLAASWGGYLLGDNILASSNAKKIELLSDSLIEVIETLLNNSIKVVLLETVPRTSKNLSSCLLKSKMFPEFTSLSECQFKVSDDIISNELNLYLSLTEQFGSELDFISVSDFFCQNGICTSYLEGTPLYRDSNHLTLEGSKLLGQKYIAHQLSK
jgi:peptidoglycan/LPS O-acetylase OafA/YrhL